MTINVELLTKTLETTKANPQHWMQSKWHCGTSHCFAGFAELIANDVSINTHSDVLIDDARFGCESSYSWKTWSNARDLLGLGTMEADELFSSFNTLEDLELIVLKLINKAKEEANEV